MKSAHQIGYHRVGRIVQSPMNPLIWIFELACGHDAYVTQKTRPKNEQRWTDDETGELMCGPRYKPCPKGCQ